MYSKIFVSVLFSILFALAAVAAPQPEPQLNGIFHLLFLTKPCSNHLFTVLSSAIDDGNLRIFTRFKKILIITISVKFRSGCY